LRPCCSVLQHLDFVARRDDFFLVGQAILPAAAFSGGALAAALLLCGVTWQAAADWQSALLAAQLSAARDVRARDRPLLLSTPVSVKENQRQHDCRHGKHECVRHLEMARLFH
jgi:hypothetical protein